MMNACRCHIQLFGMPCLESNQIADFKVICVVADGASPNRRFFKLHKIDQFVKSGVTYVIPNIYRKSGYVYFMTNVPYLIQTVHNARHSSLHNRSRNLVVSATTYCQ